MRLTIAPEATGIDLDRVDLTDPKLYGLGAPHDVWREMRQRDPVRWQDCATRGFWSVTTMAEANQVLCDHHTFTSERGILLDLLGRDDPSGGHQLALTDPPRHTDIQARLQEALSRHEVAVQEQAIRSRIRAVIDDWPDGEVTDVAGALSLAPVAIMGDLMGLPEPDWPTLGRLTATSVAPADPHYCLPSGVAATRQSADRELFGYLSEQVQQRRRTGGEDLIGLLLASEVEGRRLAPSEVVTNAFNVLLGGNVTMPNVVTALLSHPEAPSRYGEWAEVPVADLVEEAMRLASPPNHFLRYACHDAQVGGARILAGQAVAVWFGSANRDRAVFDQPDTFRPGRSPNRHIALGVGPHYCLAHRLARTTLRVWFEELFAAVRDLEPAGPAVHLHSNLVAGITELPMRIWRR